MEATGPSRVAWRAALTAAVVALPLASCGGQGSTGPVSSTSVTSPQTSLSTPNGTSDRTAVERAYIRFWQVAWPLDQLPQDQWRAVLEPVATDPQLTQLLELTRVQVDSGIVLYGQVTSRVTNVDLRDTTATVTDCQDAANAGQMEKKTGNRKTVGVDRSPVIATMVRGTDGVWRVSQIKYTGGSC